MIQAEIRKRIVSIVVEKCGKCTIYLFGSYAYGNPDQSSDMDIAVILDKVDSKVEKIAELSEALKELPFAKDIVVTSRREFEFYRKEAGSLFRTIDQKGIVLNAE